VTYSNPVARILHRNPSEGFGIFSFDDCRLAGEISDPGEDSSTLTAVKVAVCEAT
jgi:hypothetical protein